jgi:hypothetical protein
MNAGNVLVIQDHNRPPIRSIFFTQTLGSSAISIISSPIIFRPKLAHEYVLFAKFLVARDPAENRRPAGHPGFAIDGAKAFALGKAGRRSIWQPESYNPRAGRAWVGHRHAG